MQTLIEVTQEDIDSGICGAPWSCAISLAVMRALGVPQVCVSGNIAANGQSYRVPTRALNFMRKFDRDPQTAKPFRFYLVPE